MKIKKQVNMKKIIGILSQDGINNPYFTELLNTSGETPLWSRRDIGIYDATFNIIDLFTEQPFCLQNKVNFTTSLGVNFSLSAVSTAQYVVTVETKNRNGQLQDGLLDSIGIVIEFFNVTA